MNHLKGLAKKFKDDYEAHQAGTINLNKLDGPPIELKKKADKYQY